jgi:hypothetical protein
MFYNNSANLTCNTVMYIIALALADNAFENDFTYLEAVYGLIVPPELDRISLQ